jgi:hypothetical protein
MPGGSNAELPPVLMLAPAGSAGGDEIVPGCSLAQAAAKTTSQAPPAFIRILLEAMALSISADTLEALPVSYLITREGCNARRVRRHFSFSFTHTAATLSFLRQRTLAFASTRG